MRPTKIIIFSGGLVWQSLVFGSRGSHRGIFCEKLLESSTVSKRESISDGSGDGHAEVGNASVMVL